MKLTLLIFPLLLMVGCELLPKNSIEQNQANKQSCVWQEKTHDTDCDIQFWLRFWADVEDISWPERREMIESLGENDIDILKKVLLSQGISTPYQNRLRAQLWVESIFPKLSDDMRKFIQVALYMPSQSLLEMESALVTLSKINTRQMTKLEEQKSQLEKQQNQIQQLLNIEASILQNGQEDKK